jgi:hypothetical protein
MSDTNIKHKIINITKGNPGAISIISGFAQTLNKSVDEIITKLEHTDKHGSNLWILFCENGGKKPGPNLGSSSMIYCGDASNLPINEQKEALEKTWVMI